MAFWEMQFYWDLSKRGKEKVTMMHHNELGGSSYPDKEGRNREL